MNVDIRKVKIVSYIYIYIPIIIFYIGWVKSFVAIPLIFLIIMNIIKYSRNLFAENIDEKAAIQIKKMTLFIILFFSFALGLISGFGGFFAQTGDWYKHNLILNDLVTRDWPVYYTSNEPAMLTYYIGQYLLPALFGKLAGGYRVAEIAMLFYNCFGILLILFLCYKLMDARTAKKQIIVTVFPFLFGTCLFASKALYGATSIGLGDITLNHYMISNTIPLQYRSLFSCLRWIFPQAIVSWLITSLFMDDMERIDLYIILGSPLILYSPFALVGISFIMLAVFIKRNNEMRSIKFFRKIFSFENISSIIVFLIPFIYLSGNIFSEKPKEISFQLISFNGYEILFFCFIVSFMIYSVIIFRQMKENVLFYGVNISLLILPFFKMGLYNDFAMNVSIPAVWILMLLALNTWFYYISNINKFHIKWIVLSFALLIGAIYPLKEILIPITEPISITGTAQIYSNQSLEQWAKRDGSVRADAAYNYFTYDYESSLFYLMFARK